MAPAPLVEDDGARVRSANGDEDYILAIIHVKIIRLGSAIMHALVLERDIRRYRSAACDCPGNWLALPKLRRTLSLAAGLGFAIAVGSGAAKADSACSHEDHYHSHIGHVMTCWDDTPENRGFLIVAQIDAATALEHVELALANPEDMDAIQLHMRHVLNALDPAKEPEGPGLGYGLILATEGAGVHISFALQAEPMFATASGPAGDVDAYGDADGDAVDSALEAIFDESGEMHMSETVIAQATIAAQSIANATVWEADALARTKAALQQSDLTLAVADAQAVLAALTSVMAGRDLDGDGAISVAAGEGGLDQAREAMLAIMEEEGLSMPSEH